MEKLNNKVAVSPSRPLIGSTARGKKVAVYDGAGSTRTVGLYLEFEDGDSEELPFPPHYPEWLAPEFLRSEGFEIVEA